MGIFCCNEFGRKLNVFFPSNLIFGLSEVVEVPFLKFPVFVNILNFQIFGQTTPYSAHIWLARTIFSDENSIYGSYGPHTYSGILYMGHTGPIIPEKVLIYEPSAKSNSGKRPHLVPIGPYLVSIGPYLGSIASYVGPLELYLVPIEPYLALSDLI